MIKNVDDIHSFVPELWTQAAMGIPDSSVQIDLPELVFLIEFLDCQKLATKPVEVRPAGRVIEIGEGQG